MNKLEIEITENGFMAIEDNRYKFQGKKKTWVFENLEDLNFFIKEWVSEKKITY